MYIFHPCIVFTQTILFIKFYNELIKNKVCDEIHLALLIFMRSLSPAAAAHPNIDPNPLFWLNLLANILIVLNNPHFVTLMADGRANSTLFTKL